MGTRGTITIKENGQTLVKLYRQYDTYPTGLGQDLLAAIGPSRIVNGYRSGENNPEVFNGMGCLAAYLIGKLKTNIGNLYVVSPTAEDEEYNYTLEHDGVIKLTLVGHGKTLFTGPLSEFDPSKAEKEESACL